MCVTAQLAWQVLSKIPRKERNEEIWNGEEKKRNKREERNKGGIFHILIS
jgi:hypothetical protein